MFGKKTNWQILSGRGAPENAAKRDVYNQQQLERGKIADKQTAFARLFFAFVMSAILSVVVYFAYAGITYGLQRLKPSRPPEFYFAGDDYSIPRLHYNPLNETNYIGVTRVDPRFNTGENTLFQLDEFGNEVPGTKIPHNSQKDVKKIKEPDWYKKSKKNFKRYIKTEDGKSQYEIFTKKYNDWKLSQTDFSWHYKNFRLAQVLWSLTSGLCLYAVMAEVMLRNLKAQNMLSETSDINQYANDQHVSLPEEVMRKFDWFPDLGAHSDISVSSMISHVALKNKGLKSVKIAKRYDKDIVSENGEIDHLNGEIMYDDNGDIIYETKPLIDEDFMHELFSASGIEKNDKVSRKFYDVSKIPYNPGNKDIDKQKGFDTVGQLINKDWTIPWYETHRPSGAYLVDTRPVNTLVIAITRAGEIIAVECIKCEVLQFAVC